MWDPSSLVRTNPLKQVVVTTGGVANGGSDSFNVQSSQLEATIRIYHTCNKVYIC